MAPSEVLSNTVKSWLEAFNVLNVEALADTFTPDFYVSVAPASARMSPDGRVSREELLGRFTGLRPMITSLNVVVQKEWPANETSNQVALWTKGNADFHPDIIGSDSKDDWVFETETMFIVTMDESGKKIKHLFEYQDGSLIKDMPSTFQRAAERFAQKNATKSDKA